MYLRTYLLNAHRPLLFFCGEAEPFSVVNYLIHSVSTDSDWKGVDNGQLIFSWTTFSTYILINYIFVRIKENRSVKNIIIGKSIKNENSYTCKS